MCDREAEQWGVGTRRLRRAISSRHAVLPRLTVECGGAIAGCYDVSPMYVYRGVPSLVVLGRIAVLMGIIAVLVENPNRQITHP